MKFWIARDNNGFLGLYKEYPTWVKSMILEKTGMVHL